MGRPALWLLLCMLTVYSVKGSWDEGPFWLHHEGFWGIEREEYVEVNCQDTNIKNAVDQQVNDFQSNNPTFFVTKAQQTCPFSRNRVAYATLKTETEVNICFERRMKEVQQVPSWCSELQQQNDCSFSFRGGPCSVDDVKRTYCRIGGGHGMEMMHGSSNMDSILERYRMNARCSDIDPSFSGVIKTEFDQFLANPTNYIENDTKLRRTLENSKIWYGCFEEYLSRNNIPTLLNCETVVTADERNTMQQRTPMNWWGPPPPNANQVDPKKQLKDAAVANNDARKYLCLEYYENQQNTWFNWGPMTDVLGFVVEVEMQAKWSADRVSAPEAQQTMNNIENGNYAAVGYMPGSGTLSTAQPAPQEVVAYQRKIHGACKGLYDKYDPSSSDCANYQDQIKTLRSSLGMWNHGPFGQQNTFEDLLKSNNYDPRLALCMLRVKADNEQAMFPGDMGMGNYGVADFCFGVQQFVMDRQINAIYQTPDCNIAGQRSGVVVATLGNAIIGRQYDQIKQLKSSMREMDPYVDAMFQGCLTDYVMLNLNRACESEGYSARTNSIRTFVQGTSNLSKQQRKDAILGRLMQGPNKGDGMGRLCDVYAVVDGFTTDKQERSKLLKKKMMMALKKQKEYDNLANLQPATDCPGMTGAIPMFDDIDGDMGRDIGHHFGLPMPPPCINGQRNDKRKACLKNTICTEVNQVADQTCDGMTSIVTTVNNEWQKIVDAERANNNFNFYTSLQTMARNVRSSISTNRWDPNVPNQRKCSVKLMSKKLQAYWNGPSIPVNECHVMYFTRNILKDAVRSSWFGHRNNHGPPFPFDDDDGFDGDDGFMPFENPTTNSVNGPAQFWPFDNPAPNQPGNADSGRVWPFENPAGSQPNNNAANPVWPFEPAQNQRNNGAQERVWPFGN